MSDVSLRVYVQSHKSRDPEYVAAKVRAAGESPRVFIDQSDYNRTKSREYRWKGLYDTFTAILADPQDEEWKVTMQDDISFPADVFQRIRHVLRFAPRGSMLSFYNPTNAAYRECVSAGRHVLSTRANFWGQCFAFHKHTLKPLLEWGKEHIILGYNSDDRFLGKYCTYVGCRLLVVVPSFVQHDGYDRSLMGTAGQGAMYARCSENYDPAFDVSTVDWVEHFENPYADNTRSADRLGLVGV